MGTAARNTVSVSAFFTGLTASLIDGRIASGHAQKATQGPNASDHRAGA
jgi:hypothetical protein